MDGPTTTRRREQIRAAAVLGGLVFVALAIWMVALMTGDDPSPETGGAGAPTDDLNAGGAPGRVVAPEEGEEGAPDNGTDTDTDTDTDAGTDTDADDAGAGEPAPDDGSADRAHRSLDFDGQCDVEVDADELSPDLRPWQFPACERAPIALPDGQDRWIVVVASLAGEDFTEAEAVRRLDDSDRLLLWSSHYPSLNPGLWVIGEGPFDDADTAARRAEIIGDGAYPRVLSDDDEDRYCVAAGGCTGETRG